MRWCTRLTSRGFHWIRATGPTQPQLAVNWVLSQPGVTVALTGCRNIHEIEDNVGATGWALSAEDQARIEGIMQEAAGTSAGHD